MIAAGLWITDFCILQLCLIQQIRCDDKGFKSLKSVGLGSDSDSFETVLERCWFNCIA